jgi:hypothetical protein
VIGWDLGDATATIRREVNQGERKPYVLVFGKGADMPLRIGTGCGGYEVPEAREGNGDVAGNCLGNVQGRYSESLNGS